jgi:hypothetical protein
MYWDRGRASAGITTIHEGYHVCVIALSYAHGHRAPFLSVNTCMHELLHAFFQDLFVARPSWFEAASREVRIDWHATRLWLFHEGAFIRESAEAYVRRLKG